MAAGPYKRGQGWQIKWRENGRNGPWETEFFRDEREARIFKMDVEMAGNRWPEGWIPGRGYMTDAELAAEEEAEADNCTPFLPFAMRRIEDLRAARTIDQDTMRRYTQYAKAFAADAIQAEALAEVLAADDDCGTHSSTSTPPSLARWSRWRSLPRTTSASRTWTPTPSPPG